jgi:ankyrin
VLLEVPHFASLQDREREVAILQSDNGYSWFEQLTMQFRDVSEVIFKLTIFGKCLGSTDSSFLIVIINKYFHAY